MRPSRAQLKQLNRDNAEWPTTLAVVPREQWPSGLAQMMDPPIAVWRSRDFLVQIYAIRQGAQRLSVMRTAWTIAGAKDGITWDDLQRLKGECGFSEAMAVEIFPPNRRVVNVANMRHLFVLDTPLDCAW